MYGGSAAVSLFIVPVPGALKELADDLFVNVELDKKRKYGLAPMPDGSLKISELLPNQEIGRAHV